MSVRQRPSNPPLLRLLLALACCLPGSFFLPAAPAAAEDLGIAVSAGLFDIGQSQKATEAGVELRLAKVELFGLGLTPAFGISANEDGAFWGYGGFRWDLDLGEKWVVTPNFAVSLYEEGDSKDLGHVVEFRSGLEIARRIRGGRVGLALYHLSNASISDHNPGSESVILTWSSGR